MLSRCFLAAIAVVLMLPSPVVAQNLQKTFPDYIRKQKPSTPGVSDCIPFVRGGSTFCLPGDQAVTPSSPHTFSNKTIDCSVNNCVNMPGGGGGWDEPPPTTCEGRDGLAYSVGGVVKICGAAGGGNVALNGGGFLALNGGGGLAFNTP